MKIYGLLASIEKRQAELYHTATTNPSIRSGQGMHSYVSSANWELRRSLNAARRYYWDAFSKDKSNSWAVVQYLSLTFLLQRANDPEAAQQRPEQKPEDLCTVGQVLSLSDYLSEDATRKAWALGNPIELCLLRILLEKRKEQRGINDENKEREKEQITRYARDLVAVSGRDSFEVYSTRRQIVRYLEWFNELAQLDLVSGLRACRDGVCNAA